MLWIFAAALMLAAEVGAIMDSLAIDGCPELYEILIAQGEDVDPALLETISIHCLGGPLAD